MNEARKILEKKMNYLDLEMSLITSNSTKLLSPSKNLVSMTPMPAKDPKISASFHKITKEWQLLQSRREERMNEMIEKTRKKEDSLRNEEKFEQERLRQEKLARLSKKIEEIHARIKERETQLPKEKENLKALLNQTPQILKSLQEAKEKHQKEQELLYQEKLKLLKEKFKPITKEEIEAHARNHEEIMRQKLEKKKKRSVTPYKPSYKSPVYELIEAQDQEKLKEIEEEKLKKKEYMSKIKDFQEKVKKEHFPAIDPQKKQVLQEKIFKLNHPAFKFYLPKELKGKALTEEDVEPYNLQEKNPKDIGKNYLAYAKVHKKMPLNSKSLEKIEVPEDKSSLKSSKYENYLKKIHVNKAKIDDLEPLIKNEQLNIQEKKEKIFAKANQWENEAERKELLNKIKGNHSLNEEADELRVKAIKAKLALIKNTNNNHNNEEGNNENSLFGNEIN